MGRANTEPTIKKRRTPQYLWLVVEPWVLLPFLLLLRIDLLGVSDFLRLGIDGGWFWVDDGYAFAPVRFPVEGF